MHRSFHLLPSVTSLHHFFLMSFGPETPHRPKLFAQQAPVLHPGEYKPSTSISLYGTVSSTNHTHPEPGLSVQHSGSQPGPVLSRSSPSQLSYPLSIWCSNSQSPSPLLHASTDRSRVVDGVRFSPQPRTTTPGSSARRLPGSSTLPLTSLLYIRS